MAQLGRAFGFGVAALGLMAGAGSSAGCIYPDYCISIGITGTDMCQLFFNASGVDAQGEQVPLSDGVGLIQGCDCLFDAEVEILAQGDPESVEYQEIMFRLESKARLRCLELAVEQGLVEHNCVSAEIEGGLVDGLDSCTAGCVYANPPPGGRCSGECSPADDASGESGGPDEGEHETGTGSEPPAQLHMRARGSS